MKRSFALCALACLMAANGFAADIFSIDTAHSDVSFRIRHLISKTTGRFAEFSGTIALDVENPDASSVELIINAASIDTNEEDRDKHLRSKDFFDTDSYPEIRFTSHKITKAGDDSFAVTGNLDMHGVSKEINVPVTFLGQVEDPWGNTKAGFEISTRVDRKEWGISWNKAMDAGGLILGEEVEITINIEATKTK